MNLSRNEPIYAKIKSIYSNIWVYYTCYKTFFSAKFQGCSPTGSTLKCVPKTLKSGTREDGIANGKKKFRESFIYK